MMRVAVLVTALMLPALAMADEVWRWKDTSGRLHYSNVPGHVPAYADRLRRDIGHLSVPRPAPGALPTAGVETHRKPRAERARPRRVALLPSCRPFGYPYILINNPHELSDQVKQASLLDALGIPWRKGCCSKLN